MPTRIIHGRECHVHFRPNPEIKNREYIPEIAELFIDEKYVTFFPVYLYYHDEHPGGTGEVLRYTLEEARERATEKLFTENC